MSDTWDKLSAPFPVNKIHWRVGSTNKEKTSGLALAYLDARDVMDRLDDVVGPEYWQNRYPHANNKTCCEIGIMVGGEWVWKANGAGDTAHEAEKGAFSDAFKRAGVMWGIGRYLYGLENIWVPLEQAGRSVKIAESELPRLQKVLEGCVVHKPKPKIVMTGPIKTQTELQKQFRAIVDDVQDCSDETELNGVMSKGVNVINQVKKDVPKWYDPSGDYKGFDAIVDDKIERMREES